MLKPKINYKTLSKSQIKSQVNDLLSSFQKSQMKILQPPTPIDEILEIYLKIGLEFSDLSFLQASQGEEILGAIDFHKNKILVSENLDPYENPHLKGRYAFTLAHETGHSILHREYFQPLDKDQTLLSLFEQDNKPSIICRSGGEKPIEERQADWFAAYLLMPEEMVYKSFREIKPGLAKIKERESAPIIKHMARSFSVSKQSMVIRLQELSLIVGDENTNLFETSEGKFFGGTV